jgi:hypothetical protein
MEAHKVWISWVNNLLHAFHIADPPQLATSYEQLVLAKDYLLSKKTLQHPKTTWQLLLALEETTKPYTRIKP